MADLLLHLRVLPPSGSSGKHVFLLDAPRVQTQAEELGGSDSQTELNNGIVQQHLKKRDHPATKCRLF